MPDLLFVLRGNVVNLETLMNERSYGFIQAYLLCQHFHLALSFDCLMCQMQQYRSLTEFSLLTAHDLTRCYVVFFFCTIFLSFAHFKSKKQ
jgi:hypothetical protein